MGRTIGWALFLAVSWTWCIGMYLPTLLVRDGGAPFFLAFFLPNVIGAASVGFVLRSRERSARFVASLRVPMLLFSAVTVAFQAYFLGWQGVSMGMGYMLHMPGGIASGVVLVAVVTLLRGRADWLPAGITLLCSLLTGVLLLASPAEGSMAEPIAALFGLSMVTTLGFGICPYLDLSFNRAVQHAPRPAAAFGIGFFLIFAATLLFVTRGRVLWTPSEAPFSVSIDWIFGAMGLHFGAQAAFTVLAHAGALYGTARDGSIAGFSAGDLQPLADRPRLRWWIIFPIAVGLLLGCGVPFIPSVDLPGFTSPISAGEFGYRLFLGFYGLIFPVWTLMALRRPTSTDRQTIIWTLAVCALAAPFLWVGSIGRDEVWLIPGVSIVVLAGAYRFMTRAPKPV